jgi:hypothetical protein
MGKGVVIQPHIRNTEGKIVQGGAFQHHVVLGGIHADAIARVKLMNSSGLTGYLGCAWCGMCAVSRPEYKALRMLGYCCPVHIKYGWLEGQEMMMVRDAQALKLTNEQQAERAAIAQTLADQERKDMAKYIGMRGDSVVMRMLWYTDYNRLFFTPFAHAFLRGVLHDFIKAISRTKSSTALT